MLRFVTLAAAAALTAACAVEPGYGDYYGYNSGYADTYAGAYPSVAPLWQPGWAYSSPGPVVGNPYYGRYYGHEERRGDGRGHRERAGRGEQHRGGGRAPQQWNCGQQAQRQFWGRGAQAAPAVPHGGGARRAAPGPGPAASASSGRRFFGGPNVQGAPARTEQGAD